MKSEVVYNIKIILKFYYRFYNVNTETLIKSTTKNEICVNKQQKQNLLNQHRFNDDNQHLICY